MDENYGTEIINFRQIFGNENIAGHVEFDNSMGYYSEEVWYDDQIAGICSNVCPPVSDLFRQALETIDLPAIAGEYDDNDHNVCHIRNYVLTIINPTVFCNHMVRISNTICDGDNDSMRYTHRISIEDLFSSIVEGYDLLKVLNPNEVLFERRSISYLFKVHFGDVETKDAFLEAVRNIAEVI